MPTLEIDAVTRRVADSLNQLRRQRRIGLRELSRSLDELGRKIIPSSLIRAERAERRIDADDIVALALALGSTPNRLLLGPAADDSLLDLTPRVTVTARDAWRWAAGDRALIRESRGQDDDVFDLDARVAYMQENQPHACSLTVAEFTRLQNDHGQRFAQLSAAVEALLDEHIPLVDIVSYIRLQALSRDLIKLRSGARE